MDIFIGLAITIVVQLAGYVVTNKVVEDSAEIIATEVRDAIINERKHKPD